MWSYNFNFEIITLRGIVTIKRSMSYNHYPRSYGTICGLISYFKVVYEPVILLDNGRLVVIFLLIEIKFGRERYKVYWSHIKAVEKVIYDAFAVHHAEAVIVVRKVAAKRNTNKDVSVRINFQAQHNWLLFLFVITRTNHVGHVSCDRLDLSHKLVTDLSFLLHCFRNVYKY